jgi:hypothetical protein
VVLVPLGATATHDGQGTLFCNTKKFVTINITYFMSQLPLTIAAEEPVPTN